MTPKEAIMVDLVQRGVFRVDSDGAVWRTAHLTRTGRVRPVTPNRAEQLKSDGYSQVRAQVSKQEIAIGAHRLVWLVLCGDIPDGREINHRNGCRSDNHPANLEVVTPGENLLHAYAVLGRHRAAGERNGRHKLTRQQVAELRERRQAGESKRSLARRYGISPPMVRRIIDGRAWRDEFPQEVAVEVVTSQGAAS